MGLGHTAAAGRAPLRDGEPEALHRLAELREAHLVRVRVRFGVGVRARVRVRVRVRVRADA